MVMAVVPDHSSKSIGATLLRFFIALIAVLSPTASSFDSKANGVIPSRPKPAAASNMSALAAAAAAGGGSGASSSWPAMRRPPAAATNDEDDDGSAARESAPAVMNYVSPETTEISTRRDLGGSDDSLVGAIWNPTLVRVANARLLGENGMTLDANGFELRTSTEREGATLRKISFVSQDSVVDEYYPTCERLVADAIASRGSADAPSPPVACVRAFDHNVRSSDVASVGEIAPARAIEHEGGGSGRGPAAPRVQNPAGLVHADYTRSSAPRRLRDLSDPPKMNDVLRPRLAAENRTSLLDPAVVREALEGRRRYSFVNVWRSIDAEGPVRNPPLACVDAATASVDDLRTFKIHYVDRVGENYFVCPPPGSHSPPASSSSDREHSWYFYPDMTMQEALLLKQWDSAGGVAAVHEATGQRVIQMNQVVAGFPPLLFILHSLTHQSLQRALLGKALR
eukprot:CAMPEP_0172528860 /NCGR_PEP_ID=MMETSP1067-20121228/3095_1 /TAXON_ID=265564 ORGANISM="Thalassiosira punctigera, Strain Tpunct2005C2" /NCGR_SAMPLE_ID=MMETSP1067 /ASSEMBLY_ACC=CAM_ASM_000444 /LENGTH=454 /DNA_ID=CAMNT_0013312827 /DNA_START=448 /DNA_END=1813 /DNA_ORIENTATION=-